MQLPTCVFINGPSPLATELANNLADRWNGAQAHSFAAPLRDGALGTFFQGDPSIDIAPLNQWAPVAGSATVMEVFLKNYLAVLKMSFGESVLASIALQRVQENAQYFSTFIFDDGREKLNIRPLANHFGRSSCLIINLTDSSIEPHISKTIPILDLESLAIPVLVASLETYLEGTSRGNAASA